ncbi:MAG: helix-turn-helix domain-containing protein [Actinomycetota bacterium]|nr:helix-turn-helix domain-containing protein [Actinomycetota bacterium]
MTFIVSLTDPIHVTRQVDQRQGPARFACVLGGLHTAPAIIARSGLEEGVAIDLSLLGSRALLGMPAGELAGLSLQGEDVLGRQTVELRERAFERASWSDRFAVVDEILIRVAEMEATVIGRLHEAWRLLEASGGRIPVAKVAERVGVEPATHLSECFSLEFGLPPKAAARAIRFGRLIEHLRRSSRIDLAGAAAACGYCDQSHLTREFAAMAGCTPRAWMAEEFPSVQHAARAGDDADAVDPRRNSP